MKRNPRKRTAYQYIVMMPETAHVWLLRRVPPNRVAYVSTGRTSWYYPDEAKLSPVEFRALLDQRASHG